MMIACPVCRSHHEDGVAVCTVCGHDLAHLHFIVCPSCGALSAATQRHCHRCYALLGPESSKAVTATGVDIAAAVDTNDLQPDALEGASDPPPTAMAPDNSDEAADRVASPLEESTLRGSATAGANEPWSPPTSDFIIPEPETATAPPETTDEPVAPADEPAGDALAPPPFEPSPPAEPDQTLSADLAERADTVVGPERDAPEDTWHSADRHEGVLLPTPATEPRPDLLPATPRDVPLDPLAGIGAPLALARAMTQPHRASLLPPEVPADAERFDAELLQRIAAEPPSFAEGARRLPWQGGARLHPALRALFYLLVLAAAIAPLLTPGLGSAWVQPRSAVRALADTVSALPTGAPVLLVWGYDAGYGGELDPLTRAVIRHLATHAAKTEIIALSPSSLGQAQLAISQLGAEAGDCTVLGYIPVGEAGWRLLAEGAPVALPGSAAPASNAAIGDYALVLVLADSALTARGWIEQVEPTSGVTPFALVTAGSEPALLPFLSSGQLRGLLGAAWAAPEYELATGMAPEASARVSGLAWLALVIMLVAVIAMLAGPGKRDRTEGQR